MTCQRYEILLVDIKGKAKQTRELNDAQLLSSIAWLKRMNARGHDVLIRPAFQSGLALLDRLTQDDVTRLEHTGVPYRAKIEAEPDRFQI